MSVSRYELDAKCQTIGATMDSRVQRMESKLDVAMANMESKLDKSVERIELIAEQIKAENSELKFEFRSAKWLAIGTVVTVLIGFVTVAQLTSSWQQTAINLVASHTDATNEKIEKLTDALTVTNQKLEKLTR